MADFVQSNNLITLGDACWHEHTGHNQIYGESKIVVVIPCHVKHLEQGLIIDLLKKLHLITYLAEIVVVLNGQSSTPTDAIKNLKHIDCRITLLLEHPDANVQLQACLKLQNKPLRGKGYALWLGFAYVCDKYQQMALIVTLDADLKTFTPAFLDKILYPLVFLGAELNKGYYVRYANGKLTGRLARLLVFPLLQAIKCQLGAHDIYDFLSEFRYPLSGDVAITSSLISRLQVMQGWSYDLSLLVQAYKTTARNTLFQTEVTDNYQHVNRDENSHDGLLVTAAEIIDYLRNLCNLDQNQLIIDYRRCAANFIYRYECMALFNSLNFSKVEEEHLVGQIADMLLSTSTQYTSLPAVSDIVIRQELNAVIHSLVVQ